MRLVAEAAKRPLELRPPVSLKEEPRRKAGLRPKPRREFGARPRLADGLAPRFGALRQELGLAQEEGGGVRRGVTEGLSCLLAAFGAGVALGERLVGCRFLYKSYNSAFFNLREGWTSELVSACLRLNTVHFPMGGIVGPVER